MTDEAYYRDVKFVDDYPSSSDEFRGQPHQSVADTLVSILSSGDGGRAIGLEGTWGSGKSTVIDIARAKLQNSNSDTAGSQKHTFFVFDAWAHQGDPFRRVFLLELIQCLDANNAVDKINWNEELEKLETRRKRTIEQKAEKLSFLAKVAICTVPLLPISYSLINKTNSTFTVNIPYIGYTCIPLWSFGAAIIGFPFIVAASTWFTWRNGWRTSWNLLSASWWRTKEAKRGKSIIWAFTRQTDHVTTEQFIREEEATTVEFNKIFDNLINDAAEHNHRVIIVLDNLDRLPPDLIQSAWATMRNFFASTPGTARQSTLRNAWLIVPFDRAHIEAVFVRDKEGEDDEATPGFIEKTFEIVLRIAPPILSNRREFLSKKLQECFGTKISESESYQIFRIFDLYSRVRKKTITPRTIKAFVNTIAANARQWGKLIPLEHQALYALYKDDITRDIAKLQNSSILSEPIRAQVSDSEWVKSLAAAHYNVHPDDALEILLAEEIDNAIRNKETRRLTGLQGTSGFPLILDDYVSETAPVWGQGSPAALFDAAAILADVSLNDETVKNRIWQTMRSQIARIDKPIVPTDHTASGIQALISHSPPASQVGTAGELVRALSIERPDLPDAPEDAGKIWYSLFVTVAESLPSDLPDTADNEIFSAIPIQANIDYLFAIANAASDTGPIPFSAFKPKNSQDDVASDLVNLIKVGSPPNRLDSILNALILNRTCVNWPPVVGAIQTRLQVPDPPLSAADAYRLLSLLDGMEERKILAIKSVPDAIKVLNDDGSLHAILGLAKRDNHQELVALVVHQLMAHHTGKLDGPNDHPHYGSLAEANGYLTEIQTSPNDDTLVDNLAQRAIKAERFSQILGSALPEDDNLELYRASLRRMVELDTYTNLNPIDVLTKTDRIADILEPDLTKKFLQRFDDWEITDEISENKWVEIDPKFLVLSAPLATEHYKTTIDAISKGLSAFTKDQWITSLMAEDNALHLFFTLRDLGKALELGENFYDALTSHTQTLVDGAEQPRNFVARWAEFPAALSSARRMQFYSWLRNKLIDKGPTTELLRRVLDLFGTDFSSNAAFPARAEDVVRIFIDPILAEGTTESVACIETHAQAFARTIESANDADRQLISNRLKKLYEAGDDDEKTCIEFLAATLGLEIGKPKSPDEAEQNSADARSASDSSKSKDE